MVLSSYHHLQRNRDRLILYSLSDPCQDFSSSRCLSVDISYDTEVPVLDIYSQCSQECMLCNPHGDLNFQAISDYSSSLPVQ